MTELTQFCEVEREGRSRIFSTSEKGGEEGISRP